MATYEDLAIFNHFRLRSDDGPLFNPLHRRMKPVRFDSGVRFDDKNLRWGDPAYLLEPGDEGYVAPPSPPPLPVRKPRKKSHTMNSDYVPQSYGNLKAWLTKQAELDATLATAINMTAGERTDTA